MAGRTPKIASERVASVQAARLCPTNNGRLSARERLRSPTHALGTPTLVHNHCGTRKRPQQLLGWRQTACAALSLAPISRCRRDSPAAPAYIATRMRHSCRPAQNVVKRTLRHVQLHDRYGCCNPDLARSIDSSVQLVSSLPSLSLPPSLPLSLSSDCDQKNERFAAFTLPVT